MDIFSRGITVNVDGWHGEKSNNPGGEIIQNSWEMYEKSNIKYGGYVTTISFLFFDRDHTIKYVVDP